MAFENKYKLNNKECGITSLLKDYNLILIWNIINNEILIALPHNSWDISPECRTFSK